MNRKILSVSWGYTKIVIFNKVKNEWRLSLKYAYTQKRDLHNISISSTAVKIQGNTHNKVRVLAYNPPCPLFLKLEYISA